MDSAGPIHSFRLFKVVLMLAQGQAVSYRRRELLNTPGVKQISSITAEFASQED
ncbi:hypothetical protein R3I93_013247 [Phoxinus phoxinus]|uniref:Uncharacterized protein n=1 Tax=Phoxinus phoxinus TaxID=58324 RepID=A0AAN9CRZ9_9TELE